MKKQLSIIISIIILVLLVWGGNYAWKIFREEGPSVPNSPGDITKNIPDSTSPNIPEAVNNTDFPLELPKGFAISIYADGLPGARVMAVNDGNMWVSQIGQGQISHLVIQNGKVIDQNIAFRNLNKPHGLAFDPVDASVLYIAEEHRISKFKIGVGTDPEKIIDLPKGGRHFTRTLGFGPDGRLYVSIGSTCDVCNEKDERFASIYSMNKDGSDFKKVASGLRNSVFFTWHPTTQKIWATEMGRDNLGDNLPPDEINIIEGGDYGWPICYGQGIHDTNFDKNTYFMDPCIRRMNSYIDLPAHSAPLGLAFVPDSWPAEYRNDLIVAFHGSWNRSEPTGYKLARIKLSEKGEYEGMDSTGSPRVEDFISGWLSSDGKTSLGRPVDIIFAENGIMYVSDDKAGVIYKVEYLGK